jgi:hypothetical protein
MCWLSTVSYLNFVPSSLSSQFWGFCLCLSDPLNSSICVILSGSREVVGGLVFVGGDGD